MYYKKMSEKKKDEDMKKKLTVRLEDSRQARIFSMLDSIPCSSTKSEPNDFKYDNIAESDFKKRFLKNLEGNLRSNTQMKVFDQMAQDIELDEELQKDMSKKKHELGYIKMQAERSKLPAAAKCEEVLDAARNNQVIVISGETGIFMNDFFCLCKC
jgi:HrpA-like RNA helicase